MPQELYRTQLRRIAATAQTGATELNVEYIHPQDLLTIVSTCPQLIALQLTRCMEIQDFSPLENLKKLQRLTIIYCATKDYTFLERLPQLTHLILISLNTSRSIVPDSSFLQHLTRLETLFLKDFPISNALFLKQMPHLTNLMLEDCYEITKVEPSENIPPNQHIRQLWLLKSFHKQITPVNYSFLQHMPKLTHLLLKCSQLSDLSFLEYLPNLTNLSLNILQIQNIIFFKTLKRLTHLELKQVQVNYAALFQTLPQLQSLVLNGYKSAITLNLSEYLPELTKLSIHNEHITEGQIVANLPKLRQLELDCRISDYSALKTLPSLSQLTLSRNGQTDISFLTPLTQLTELTLDQNKIRDLSPIQNLIRLQTLDLANNEIKDISSLNHMTALQELNLNCNSISDLTPLKHLTSLKRLHLYQNQVKEITVLKYLTALDTLDLSYNQITTVAALQNGFQLSELDIRGNRIEVFDLDLALLPQLTFLMMHKNPFKNLPEAVYGGQYRQECNETVRAFQKENREL